MIEVLLVSLMFVITFFVVIRTGALSPAAIVCEFSTLSIAVFCYIVFGGGREAIESQRTGGLSFSIGDYHQEAPIVIGIYCLITVLTAVATLGLSKNSGTSSGSTGNYIQALMDLFLFSSAMPLIAGGFLAMTALSLLLVSVGAFNSPIVQVVNMGIGPLTIIYVSLLIYCWGKQSRLVLGMLLLLVVYNYSFLLAFYSRFASLTLVVATGLIASKRVVAGKRAISISVLVFAALSAWTFVYALQGRGDRTSEGANPFIWPLMIAHFLNITLDSTTFTGAAANIFQGPMVLAECIGNGSTVSYDPQYMYLSFSPLPAFLDGWRSIIGAQHFVNAYTPFSSFAEVYFFGGPYIIFFAILMIVCTRVLTKIYMQIGGAAGLLLMSPCVYSLLCLHQYALRNSLRLLYFTTLSVYFLSIYLNKQVKKSGYVTKPSSINLQRTMHSTVISPRVYFKK